VTVRRDVDVGETDRSNERPRFIAGRNPVREALEGDLSRVERMLLQNGASGPLLSFQHQAKEMGVPVQFVPAQKLNGLVPGVNHQGVILSISPVDYWDLDEMLNIIAADIDTVRAEKPIVVVLDHIQDPHNLGAIVRSCAAVGVKGVIIPDRNAAPVTAASIKTSAGTLSQVMIARVVNLGQVIQQLKERGYWVAGAEGSGDTRMDAMDWDRPLAVVIGGEEKGMTRKMREACDYLVSIPVVDEVESLNASVAAGILLFQARLARLAPPG